MSLTVRDAIGFCIIAIFAGVMFIYLLLPPVLDEAQSAVQNMLIGALIGSTTTVIGFHFGSSSGSKDKDDALIAATSTMPNPYTEPLTVTVEKQELEADVTPGVKP